VSATAGTGKGRRQRWSRREESTGMEAGSSPGGPLLGRGKGWRHRWCMREGPQAQRRRAGIARGGRLSTRARWAGCRLYQTLTVGTQKKLHSVCAGSTLLATTALQLAASTTINHKNRNFSSQEAWWGGGE
jgi:hypothetical protein